MCGLSYKLLCKASPDWCVHCVPTPLISLFPIRCHYRKAMACCAIVSVKVRSALLPVMAVSGGGLFPSSPPGLEVALNYDENSAQMWDSGVLVTMAMFWRMFHKYTSNACIAFTRSYSLRSDGYYKTERSNCERCKSDFVHIKTF